MVRPARRSSWLRALCMGGQSPCSKAQGPAHGSFSYRPCVWVGKTHVPKHKDGPLCMGRCGVRGIFSAYVRRLLLSIIPWGRSFPYRPSFFYKCDRYCSQATKNLTIQRQQAQTYEHVKIPTLLQTRSCSSSSDKTNNFFVKSARL
jgi:hypothetical protein